VLPYLRYYFLLIMKLKEKYRKTFEYFSNTLPEPETELEYTDPYELIVAVILSAQCTDKRVNMITPALLKAFPDVSSMAAAKQAEVYEYIKSCSYPNNKSKHLIGMARMLMENFNGRVPSEPELLQQLPGVGRKTANVVASVIFNKPVIAVDTHVFRVSLRIGLVTGAKTPLEAEYQLTKNIPDHLIPKAHHWLLLHGRYICKAKNPLCHSCGMSKFCNYYLKINGKKIA
jgi:endonuclease-3